MFSNMFLHTLNEVLFDELDNKMPLYPKIKETPDKGNLILSYDVPGATKEEFTIETDDQCIIVKGISGRYKDSQSKLKLNNAYDNNNIEAELKNGVLTIEFKPTATKTRSVYIK